MAKATGDKLAGYRVEPTDLPGRYMVRKPNSDEVYYLTLYAGGIKPSCTCIGFNYRRYCKHQALAQGLSDVFPQEVVERVRKVVGDLLELAHNRPLHTFKEGTAADCLVEMEPEQWEFLSEELRDRGADILEDEDNFVRARLDDILFTIERKDSLIDLA